MVVFNKYTLRQSLAMQEVKEEEEEEEENGMGW